jgi:hypothetical protein
MKSTANEHVIENYTIVRNLRHTLSISIRPNHNAAG